MPKVVQTVPLACCMCTAGKICAHGVQEGAQTKSQKVWLPFLALPSIRLVTLNKFLVAIGKVGRIIPDLPIPLS